MYVQERSNSLIPTKNCVRINRREWFAVVSSRNMGPMILSTLPAYQTEFKVMERNMMNFMGIF
jgi:hypothetical protein